MFDIYKDSKVVGTAQVQRKGLYYQFICSCKPPDKGIYRIWVSDGCDELDLGICVPEGDTYTLTKHLPVKLLKGETFNFTLQSKDWKKTGSTPESEKLFPHLDMLEQAKLSEVNGQEMIIIEQVQDRQDSDLNPEYVNRWEQP